MSNIDMSPLLTKSHSKLFLLLIFLVLTLMSFIILPYDDSYYYWDWGRHLSLSYYDGPPMIAYFIRLFTMMFGNTIFAINFLGVVSIYATLFFIYLIGKILFSKRIALNACILYLLAPLVIHYLFIWVTYDNPLNIFWAMTIYFSIRFIEKNKIIDLYRVGVSSGLLLLSKYTGIILLISLLIFVFGTQKYRALLKNKHFYFSMMITLLLFSPVIIWNYQHHWVSFQYQLGSHKSGSGWHSVLSYLERIAINFSIYLVLPIYALYEKNNHCNLKHSILLLHIIMYTSIIFFLFKSLNYNIATHWMPPIYISSAILCAYYFAQYKLQRLYLLVLILLSGIATLYLIGYSIFQNSFDGNTSIYILAKEARKNYWHNDAIVVTTSWEKAARLVFWFPDSFNIYTLPCGNRNQYAYWSKFTMQNIKNKELKEVLYIDVEDKLNCVQNYFNHCEPLKTLTKVNKHFRFNKQVAKHLFLYRCMT